MCILLHETWGDNLITRGHFSCFIYFGFLSFFFLSLFLFALHLECIALMGWGSSHGTMKHEPFCVEYNNQPMIKTMKIGKDQ
jgi:hypothetical protein